MMDTSTCINPGIFPGLSEIPDLQINGITGTSQQISLTIYLLSTTEFLFKKIPTLRSDLLPALPSLQPLPPLLHMRKLAHQLRESEWLNKNPIRQVSQVRQCELLPSQIRLLGQDPLVTFESEFELGKEGLDTGFVGLSVTFAGFEDFFVGDLRSEGVEVGLFDGEGLTH